MQRIRQLVAIAQRRLDASAFAEGAHWALLLLGSLVLLLLIASRLTPAVSIPWLWVLPTVAILAIAAGVWRAVGLRREPLEVAMAIDLRLGLRERLSNAMACVGRDDPFAQATVEDGVQSAAAAEMPNRVRRGFPIEPPRAWWTSPLLVLVGVAVLAMPQGDIFARERPIDDTELVAVRQEVETSRDRILREIEENPELRDQLADLVDELEGMDLGGDNLRSPEEMRREMIRRATEVNERLAEIVEGERGMTERALRDAMRQLERPNEGPGKEMIEAMQRGDFRGAKEALEQLLEDLEAGRLDPGQREALKEQMEALAEQLERLAEQRQALEDALRRAGLDPQLANNPEALKQAMENSENLNQEQREQLQKMAQAQQQACQMCEAMGAAAAAMAGQMGEQDGDGMAAAAEGMQEMLGDAEMLQMMLMQAQLAMAECDGQCQGMGQGLAAGRQRNIGGGMGGPGIGAGGEAEIAPTPTGRRLVKENVAVTGGDIIARQLVRGGEQITGEARQRLRRLVSEEFAGAEESVSEENIPPHLRDVHRVYFGRVAKRIEESLGDDRSAADDE